MHDLSFELPEESGSNLTVHAELPIKRLPAGKTVSFIVTIHLAGMGQGPVVRSWVRAWRGL